MIGLIFDLDQTLLDTSIAESFRKERLWNQVYSLIPEFNPYPDLIPAIQHIHALNYPIAIVSSSPASYCEKVAKHWKIPYNALIGFHDTPYHKPHPQPISKALERLKTNPHSTLSFGDKMVDIQASQSAKVISVGCLWGSLDPESLINSHPNHILYSPKELLPLFKAILNTLE
jgi:phosphoglycolate phosphatase/pyrophosphatase PpaX